MFFPIYINAPNILKNKRIHQYGIFFQTKILFVPQKIYLDFSLSIWVNYREINPEARHNHYQFQPHGDQQFLRLQGKCIHVKTLEEKIKKYSLPNYGKLQLPGELGKDGEKNLKN